MKKSKKLKPLELIRSFQDSLKALAHYYSIETKWKDCESKNESTLSFWKIGYGINGINTSYRSKSTISRLITYKQDGIWLEEIMCCKRGNSKVINGSSWWRTMRVSAKDAR